MIREVNLDPKRLLGFIRTVDIVVLYVGPEATIDERIAAHFETFGHVDDRQLEQEARSLWPVEIWVRAHRARLGLSYGLGLPRGHYLFLGGVVHGCDFELPISREVADQVIAPFDTKIRRFRRYPYLLDAAVTPETRALEWVLDGTPASERPLVATCVSLYEAARRRVGGG